MMYSIRCTLPAKEADHLHRRLNLTGKPIPYQPVCRIALEVENTEQNPVNVEITMKKKEEGSSKKINRLLITFIIVDG